MPRFLLLVLLATGLVTCARPGGDPPATPSPFPTVAQAGGLTYRGLSGVDKAVTLTNGRWEGEPYLPGAASRPTVVMADIVLSVGDVGSDGASDALVMLGVHGAGTGDLVHLGLVSAGPGGGMTTAVLLLGDRVQVRDARIEEGQVVADLLRAGPEDAACCPGELARITIARNPAGALEVTSSLPVGRLSVDSLETGEWVLERWDRGEPFVATRPPTVALASGALKGFGGCNRYSASVVPGEFPGALQVGPVAGTRMACPDAEAGMEGRFLAALQGATRLGWNAGRLWISYDGAGRSGVMLFGRSTGS